MKKPTIRIFDLLEEYKDAPFTPKTFEDIPEMILNCEARGLKDAAEYLVNWKTYIEHQIKAEWDENVRLRRSK